MGCQCWLLLGGSNLMIYHRSIRFSRPGEGTNSWTGGMMGPTPLDLLRNLSCSLRGKHSVLSFIILQKYQEMNKTSE